MKRHKYKIAVGVPIIVLMIVNINLIDVTTNTLSLSGRDAPFVTELDEFTIDVSVSTHRNINTSGATIVFPNTLLEVTELSLEDSIIDLWVNEPSFSNELGIIEFSGGITEIGGFQGNGNIFSITFTTKKKGVAPIRMESALLLAHDGKGTNILSHKEGTTLFIRESGTPSPDVNQDGVFDFSDIRTLAFKLFGEYDNAYDLNTDGTLDYKDIALLFNLLLQKQQ